MSYCVFLDFDETLINAKSMFAVVEEYFLQTTSSGMLAKVRFILFKLRLKNFAKKNICREHVNKHFYNLLTGFSVSHMNVAGSWWFVEKGNEIFNSRMLTEIKKHQSRKAEIVVVTGSFRECVKPICDLLNIKHLICTQLEECSGFYTGRMLNNPIIGEGKANRIIEFVTYNNLSLKNSYAYGDHESDIPMLKIADNSVVIGNNIKLIKYAKENNWLVIN